MLRFLRGSAALVVWTGRSLLRCDVMTGLIERSLAATRGALAAAIGPEALVAFGRSTGDIALWSGSARAPHDALVTSISFDETLSRLVFSPDGRTLAIGTLNGFIYLWNVATSRPARVLRGHEESIDALAFNADGTLLASGSADRTVRLWDTRAGKEIKVFKDIFSRVDDIGLSPDGEWLVWVSNGLMGLREVARGELQTSLDYSKHVVSAESGYREHVVSAEFNPDGTLLASASEDGTVRIWTVPGGVCVAVLVHLRSGWVSFTPEGCYKLGGDTAGAFWHEIGNCRFEPGELDPFLPFALRIPNEAPLFERAAPSPAPRAWERPARAE
ncbi:hypothetical protein WMF30_35310 [Sorangium sp. So ce134]